MIRGLTKLLLCTLACASLSCASGGSAASLAARLEPYAEDILPDYKRYLEADRRLEPSTLKVRTKHADELRRLINEALGRS